MAAGLLQRQVHQQTTHLVERLHRRRDRRQALLFDLPGPPLGRPLRPLLRVQRRGQFAYLPSPNILPHDPTLHAPAPGVVPPTPFSSLPTH